MPTPHQSSQDLGDQQLIEGFRRDFATGCDFLAVYSRRQDIGIQKCERGVELGYLRFQEVVIDQQETHWRYYWTDKARAEFDIIDKQPTV